MKTLSAGFFASILMTITFAAAEEREPRSAPDETLTFRPHPKLSERQFVIEGRDPPAAAKIGVFRLWKDKRIRMQTLRGLDAHQGRIELVNEVTWRVEDLNFDGYLDVGLLWSRGGTGNTLYYYWLFDRTTGRYALNEPLSEMMNVEVDAKRRVLHTHPMHRFTWSEYRWRKGKLVRTKHVSEEEGLRINAEAR